MPKICPIKTIIVITFRTTPVYLKLYPENAYTIEPPRYQYLANINQFASKINSLFEKPTTYIDTIYYFHFGLQHRHRVRKI